MTSRLRRLLGMTPGEVAGRARQALAKVVDRRMRRHRQWPMFDASRLAALPAPALFPGPPSETIRALDDRFPDARARLLASGDACLAGRLDLLGYRGLSFGQPLDWHLDPTSGRRAPVVHWSRIDPLDTDAIGDSKVIWELSRHQWLVRLGQAYRLSGDEHYAEAAVAHIDAWIEANPREIGINWVSSLEVAFRLIAWCWTLHLLAGARAVSDGARVRILSAMWAHGHHVERYLSYYFSPNTHLTGEALGLLYAGSALEGLPRTDHWRSLGREILEREALKQILADGVYFEQSTYYQRYTAEIYLHFLALSRRGGRQVSPDARHRVKKLLDALMVLLRPDSSMPQVGDADGGWLLPLESRQSTDVRGVFSTAAVLLENPEYAWVAGGLQPETLWLLGPAAVEAYARLHPSAPRAEPSQTLADGGYVVLRSAWEPDADQVLFDVGPLGCPHSSGHGHADLLAIQCVFRGRKFVVDPGTGSYTDVQGWRTHFRSTAAHSTVEVDGLGQATPLGPFAWNTRPVARLLRWQSGPDIAWAEAEHRAYERLPDPVVHRRRVFLVKRGGYCVVVDDLQGAGEHRLDVRFQLAPGHVLLGTDQWVRAGGSGGHGLLIRAFSSIVLKATLSEGEIEPRAGWVSPDYGVQVPAPLLTYTAVARFPVRVLTALVPTTHPLDLSAISALTASGEIIGLAIDREHFLLDPVSVTGSAA